MALRRVLRKPAAELGHTLRHSLSAARLRTAEVDTLRDHLHDGAMRYAITSAIVSRLPRGSALPAIAQNAEEAKTHFESVARLLRQLGIAELPTIATVDGHITGPSVGIAAHASACVVTERARMSLPGVAFGYTPESFASYQLAKLPKGLGAYLALTGATLSAQEMVQVGLATHATESTALWRIAEILSTQSNTHLGRTLRNIEEVCLTPRFEELSEADALFHMTSITECFGKSSLVEIVQSLESGRTPWHEQALAVLRASSPLALHLTFNAIQRSANAKCWTSVLNEEAVLNTRALQAVDYRSGAKALELHKRELDRQMVPAAALDRTSEDDDELDCGSDEQMVEMTDADMAKYGDVGLWEHESIENVPSSVVDAYFS